MSIQGRNVLSKLPEGARVLIVRLRSMGDIILTTPAIRLLHQARPDLKISVLVEHPWNQLLENNPAIDRILVMDGKIRTAWRILRSRFDLVINLHGGPTSALFTRVSLAKWRAGFEHFRDASAYNLHVPKAQEILDRQGPVHTAEHAASCMFWLGVPESEVPAAEVHVGQDAWESVGRRMTALGFHREDMVPGRTSGYAVIHPVATYETKRWKSSKFAEIGDHLRKDYGLSPVYICAAGEEDVLDEVEHHSAQPILRAEGWSLRDMAALISGARVFVGNDSGPAHLAAASGIPLVVLFGSSHSAVWHPWKAAAGSVLVKNDFDCNPCPGDRCYAFDQPRCILSISPDQVKVCLEGLLRPQSAARM